MDNYCYGMTIRFPLSASEWDILEKHFDYEPDPETDAIFFRTKEDSEYAGKLLDIANRSKL